MKNDEFLQEAEWFLRPKHLGPDTPASLSTPSRARTAGTVGARLASQSENNLTPTTGGAGELNATKMLLKNYHGVNRKPHVAWRC